MAERFNSSVESRTIKGKGLTVGPKSHVSVPTDRAPPAKYAESTTTRHECVVPYTPALHSTRATRVLFVARAELCKFQFSRPYRRKLSFFICSGWGPPDELMFVHYCFVCFLPKSESVSLDKNRAITFIFIFFNLNIIGTIFLR